MTDHWNIYGHDWAVDYLRKTITNRRVRHAYLFVGTESIGKMTLARAFAAALNCTNEDMSIRPCGECRNCKLIRSGNHTDILYSQTDPNTGVLKIEEVRSISARLAMKPYEGRYRIAIFDNFDHAQPRAQDALLKTLEEPPSYALLILLATSLEPILPTITSRSQILHLRPVPVDLIRELMLTKYEQETVRATLLAGLSGGRIGWAIRAVEEPGMLDQRQQALDLLEHALTLNRAGRFGLAEDLAKDKTALGQLLELWLTFWRDVMHKIEGSDVKLANADRQVQIEQLVYKATPDEVIHALRSTRQLLNQLPYNINTRLALEALMLEYPGLVR